MFDLANIFWELIKEKWKVFFLIIGLGALAGFLRINFIEIKKEACYIAAPYYEVATDFKFKLEELSNAINRGNQNYINKYLNDSLNVNDFENSYVKKLTKGADFTYKHVKVGFFVDVKNSTNLPLWDVALKKFYESYCKQDYNIYRRREVLKERVKLLNKEIERYSGVHDSDYVFLELKDSFNRDSVIVNDSNMVDLVFARYIAELRNTYSVNEIITLQSSFGPKDKQQSHFKTLTKFTLIPALIWLFLISAYQEYKGSR